MKRTDIAALVAYVTQLAPAQQFDEYTAAAWHDVLGDLDATFEQAREATAAVAREQQWIFPSAIREKLLPILRAANPQPRAAILQAPPSPREERIERGRRGNALVRAALANATPYRLGRQDAAEVPENLRKAREVAAEYRASQAYRDKNLKLGRAGAEVLTQINRYRKANQ